MFGYECGPVVVGSRVCSRRAHACFFSWPVSKVGVGTRDSEEFMFMTLYSYEIL